VTSALLSPGPLTIGVEFEESEQTTAEYSESALVEHADSDSDTVQAINELLVSSSHAEHSDVLAFAHQVYPNDVALWPRTDKYLVEYWAVKSPSECRKLQNCDHSEKKFH